MKLSRTLTCAICSFALASAAWAGGGLHSESSGSYSPGSYSSMSEFPSTSEAASEPMQPELLSSEQPEQYVIVEEWYIFPSSEEISLGS